MTFEEVLAELLRTSSQRPAPEVNAALQSIWPELRAPQRNHAGAELIALFRRAGYVSDDVQQPTGGIAVYRGELVETREPGISWTVDPEIATRYARGYATIGHTQVVQATTPPEAILGRFTQDAEVVVDPELLCGITRLGYIPHFTLSRLAPL